MQISLVDQQLYSAYHFKHIVLYSILHISLYVMPCCFCILLLQVFGITNILLHIHVPTCVNVPSTLGHMTTQIKCCFAVNYIINHSFIHVCIS